MTYPKQLKLFKMINNRYGNKVSVFDDNYLKTNQEKWDYSCMYGYQNLMIHLLNNNIIEDNITDTVAIAAFYDQLKTIKWLHKHKNIYIMPSINLIGVYYNDNYEVNLNNKNWKDNKIEQDFTSCPINNAVINGHLEIVKWLYNNEISTITQQTMLFAIKNNHLDILKWLHKHGGHCGKFAIDTTKNEKILDWIEKIHKKWSTRFNLNSLYI